MILNIFGTIAGGIWLAFYGEWRLIGGGIAYAILSIWVFPLLTLPALAFAPLALKLKEKDSILFYPVGFLSNFYTNLLIIASCTVAFIFCIRFHDGGTKLELIPYLLWSWGMGLGPWQAMSSKENENEFEAITMFSACTCYMLFFISLFFGDPFPSIAILLTALTLLFILPIFNLWLGNKMDQRIF